jgi:hypothetical protein
MASGDGSATSAVGRVVSGSVRAEKPSRPRAYSTPTRRIRTSISTATDQAENAESSGMPDEDLRRLLQTLSPSAREHLRDVLIRDHADRDAIASMLMRYRDENGQGWADIIDLLTMYPDARRRVMRSSGRSRLDKPSSRRCVTTSQPWMAALGARPRRGRPRRYGLYLERRRRA